MFDYDPTDEFIGGNFQELRVTADYYGCIRPRRPQEAQFFMHRRKNLRGAVGTEKSSGMRFKGKDHQDTLSQIIERDPVEPRRLNSRIPKQLETIVLKCLRKDPGDRYGTAEALGQDLRRFVRGDPIEARPQSAWEKVARRTWRHKTRVGTIACVLLLLVTSAVIVWQYVKESHRKQVMQYEQMVRDAASGQLLCQMHSAQDVSGALGRGTLHDLLGARPGLHPVEQTLEELKEAAALFPERVEAHYYSARGNLFQRRDLRAAEEPRCVINPLRLRLASQFAQVGRHGGELVRQGQLDQLALSPRNSQGRGVEILEHLLLR